jgi:periplasmic divalent cation tolerance protein
MTDAILVLTTLGGDDPRAEEIARALVDERLAACVNVLAPMVSVYRWKGSVERDTERQLVIKTTRGRLETVKSRLAALHPYELPELIVIPIDGGGEEYLSWVSRQTD